MTKNLLNERTVLIMFSSRQMMGVNLCSMLFVLMGERSSSSSQSVVMNVFTDTPEIFLGAGFWRTAINFSLLVPQPGSVASPLPCSESRDTDLLKRFTVNDVTLGNAWF